VVSVGFLPAALGSAESSLRILLHAADSGDTALYQGYWGDAASDSPDWEKRGVNAFLSPTARQILQLSKLKVLATIACVQRQVRGANRGLRVVAGVVVKATRTPKHSTKAQKAVTLWELVSSVT